MSNYWYSTVQGEGVKKPGGEWARGRTSQGANEPGGERAKGQNSQAQGANKPGGERAWGRTSKGARKPDTFVPIVNVTWFRSPTQIRLFNCHINGIKAS